MADIRPFKAVRPVKDKAEHIAALPYDVMNTAEAKASRMKTMVNTGKWLFSNCLIHTKLNPQKSMASRMERYPKPFS